MPPKAASKRAAPASRAGTAAKKSKCDRWAAVSASRNADADFKLAVKNVERANGYICICKPYFLRDDASDDEWEDETDSEVDSEAEDEGGVVDLDAQPKPVRDDGQVKCGGGEKCPCQKPASENPNYDCIITYAGFRKWMTQRSMAAVRNPKFFDMHTWSDHEGHGILEVCHNLVLDWVEAKTWQEQWAVCEGFVFFLLGDGESLYM